VVTASAVYRRESVGIEPTSPLAKASAVLKTVRDTSPVLSHDVWSPCPVRVCASFIPARLPLFGGPYYIRITGRSEFPGQDGIECDTGRSILVIEDVAIHVALRGWRDEFRDRQR